MSITVCFCSANAMSYPEGGGHLWFNLNWALGLRALGCRVIWMELVKPTTPAAKVQAQMQALRRQLQPFGLDEHLAVSTWNGEPVPEETAAGYLDLGGAADAEMLLNLMQYNIGPRVVQAFRRSAFVNTDPGILDFWMRRGVIDLSPHDAYFVIGEPLGQRAGTSRGRTAKWEPIPPCVTLSWWPVTEAPAGARFTTVSHWHMNGDWLEDEHGRGYDNSKRSGFLPFLDLPRQTSQWLELAVALDGDTKERALLEKHGWRAREAHAVTATPADYQRYIQESRGEFSCAKPSCVRGQTGWISDRTVCYLASGKPAVVQYTGPSRFLSGPPGVLRFRDLAEAARCLDLVAGDYERHCRWARELAEEVFDSRKVVANVLERSLR